MQRGKRKKNIWFSREYNSKELEVSKLGKQNRDAFNARKEAIEKNGIDN
jgi:hypothetical protein